MSSIWSSSFCTGSLANLYQPLGSPWFSAALLLPVAPPLLLPAPPLLLPLIEPLLLPLPSSPVDPDDDPEPDPDEVLPPVSNGPMVCLSPPLQATTVAATTASPVHARAPM